MKLGIVKKKSLMVGPLGLEAVGQESYEAGVAHTTTLTTQFYAIDIILLWRMKPLKVQRFPR